MSQGTNTAVVHSRNTVSYSCIITNFGQKFKLLCLGCGAGCRLGGQFCPLVLCMTICLQCFDTVGWAAGRASGL